MDDPPGLDARSALPLPHARALAARPSKQPTTDTSSAPTVASALVATLAHERLPKPVGPSPFRAQGLCTGASISDARRDCLSQFVPAVANARTLYAHPAAPRRLVMGCT